MCIYIYIFMKRNVTVQLSRIGYNLWGFSQENLFISRLYEDSTLNNFISCKIV